MKSRLETRFFRRLQKATETTYIVDFVPTEQIINGLLYSEANSTRLADFHRSLEAYENGWLDEALFRTPNGRFFLSLFGGPDSVHHIGGWCGGQILPLCEDDVRQWLEMRGLIAEYKAIFGLPEAA